MKTKRFLSTFLFISLVICYISFAEANENIMSYLQLENQFIADKEGVEPGDYLISYNENTLFLIEKPISSLKKGDKVIIYQISQEGHKHKEVTMQADDWLNNFTCYNNKLFLLGQYYIYVYKNLFTGNPIFEYKIKIPESFSRIYIYDKKIILTKSCISCEDNGTKAFIYDLTKNQGYTHIFDNPVGFALTYMTPKRNINFYKGNIIISDITNYRIRIYDLDFKLVSEFSRPTSDWDKGSNQVFNEEIKNIKTPNMLNSKRKFITENSYKHNVVHLVDFLNDSTIMVCWTSNSSQTNQNEIRTFYDVWRKNKNSNNWYLIYKNLTDISPKPQDKFNFDYFYQLFWQYFVLNDKVIVSSYFPIDLRKLDLKNLTFQEFNKMQGDYYKNNDIKCSFFIYKFKEK
ncbi:MAG TPA: hypothetical protein PLC04_04835 [Candidatus Kapabacteria bacterium]|nr:hypothetical protein [Candidatus Kapabacteria bacterium]